MTVILDPGNQTESWDANSRQWRESSGLWKNNAIAWQNNYNYEVGQYNAMTVDRNNWQAAYYNMQADRDAWQARSNQAYDQGTWGYGNLWSTDAHGDPGVWTNRYNQGYADALPPGLSILSVGINTSSYTNNQWQDVPQTSFAVNRTGYWTLLVHFYFGGGAAGSGYGGFTRMRWGGTIGVQQNFNNPAPGATNFGWSTIADGGSVLIGAGQTVAPQMFCNTGVGLQGTFMAIFTPINSYPK